MSQMIEIPVRELEGSALDWAVATVEGYEMRLVPPQYGNPARAFKVGALGQAEAFRPSTDWAQGGPLIIKYGMNVSFCNDYRRVPGQREFMWAEFGGRANHGYCNGHSTPLVAVCRALVKSWFGDTVKVPAELLERAV